MNNKPPSDTDKDKAKVKRRDSDAVLALDDYRADPSIDDQALQWLVKLSDHPHQTDPKQTTRIATERAAFLDWLAEDPAHAQAFEDATALWAISKEVAAKPVFQSQPAYQPAWASLATAAALLVVTFFIFALQPDVYATQPGEQQRIILSDGSTAFLNTDSAIQVSMHGDKRAVSLERGEVWFDVAHDPAQPFVVRTGDITAQAVGTAFAVRKQDEQAVLITVTEGLVDVRDAERGLLADDLTIGQQLKVELSEVRSHALFNVDTARELAWQRGVLVYQDVALQALLTDLNRYVQRNMALSDAAAGQATVSAVIQIADQEAMLDALQVSMGLNWKAVSDELILITPRKIN